MFYILNFKSHYFTSAQTTEAAKAIISRICQNTETTVEDIEVINAFQDEIRCTGADFLRYGEECFT